MDADDRLSSLPDDLISHILSFLQTKYAVGTSVLSRRWKDLWVRVTSLDLDNRKPPNWNARDFEFCRFVHKVLSQQKNLDSVRRFRFHYLNEISDARFNREFVFGPAIEEIDVFLWGRAQFGLPQCMRSIPESFYTLNNLKVAKLSWVLLGATKGSVFLPSLKILQLCYVEIEDFESLGRLIYGCPVVETLHLENCRPENEIEKDRIEASLPFLKNLKVVPCVCPIVIEAPKLEDLYLEHCAEFRMTGKGPLPCLHTAHVDVRRGRRSSYRDLIWLLNQISNAKKIDLYGDSLVTRSDPLFSFYLSDGDDVQFPVIPNLTHLTIRNGWRSWVLYNLLNSASKLQSLVIDMQRRPYGSIRWEGLDFIPGGPLPSHSGVSWECWLETAGTPECLLSSLEVIDIKDLVEFENDWEMTVYLLGAGAVLKKVNMHVYTCDHEFSARMHFASLRRQSKGPSHWEPRLFLPNNTEIRNDDETEDVEDYFEGDDVETEEG